MGRIGILAGAALIGAIPTGALIAQTPATTASTTVSQTGASAGTTPQPGGWGQGGWQSGSAPAPAALTTQPVAQNTTPAWTADSQPRVTTYQVDPNTSVTRVERPGPMPAVVGGSVLAATPGTIITTTTTKTDYVTSYSGGAVKRRAVVRPTRRYPAHKPGCSCKK